MLKETSRRSRSTGFAPSPPVVVSDHDTVVDRNPAKWNRASPDGRSPAHNLRAALRLGLVTIGLPREIRESPVAFSGRRCHAESTHRSQFVHGPFINAEYTDPVGRDRAVQPAAHRSEPLFRRRIGMAMVLTRDHNDPVDRGRGPTFW
jgi:hypothetical protein